MIHRLPLAVLIAAAVWPSVAEAGAPDDREVVVVTAAPPDPVGNAAFSVSTLTQADIEGRGQLDNALSQVPGLSLFRRDSSLSANPTTQGVSLRSIAPSGAGRALVTLDGVPQNDPFGGWVIWSSLPPEGIGGAQVVRGAGAGPYGAGALTGVIALDTNTGLDAVDASLSQQNGRRVAGREYVELGSAGVLHDVGLSLVAANEDSDGWIPISPAQRGAADDAVSYHARSVSLEAQAFVGHDVLTTLRLGTYGENRNSGLVGAASSADGVTASLNLTTIPAGGTAGWRVQAWLRNSGFSNTSVSIGAGRASTTLTNDQYSTPALGWGFNAALRGDWFGLSTEIGADARFAQGNSKEHFQPVAGVFTMGRVTGGRTFVGGIYVETAAHLDRLTLTAGLRADQWASTGGHLVQTVLSSGAVTANQTYPSKSGVVPTARLGARQDLGGGYFVRAAGYGGFRPPTLNELYRPFRQGTNLTEANPGLVPEKLYGAEIGIGGDASDFGWGLTGFYNALHGAITNVTVGHGPLTVPGLGAVAASGLLIQRQNAGNIDAYGLEGDAHWQVADGLALRAAFDYVDAHVEGGATASQLTGKRPSQAPRLTLTAGLSATPIPDLTVTVDTRYESNRFADDQNTLPLGTATTVDARVSYRLWNGLSAYVAGDNLLNARIATTESADLIASYASPRVLRIGLSWTE